MNQCTKVYTVNKPRLSSKNEQIFLIHLTIQFIDLEMLYISVRRGINFGTFSIFWIRINWSRRFLQKLSGTFIDKTWIFQNYNTEPQNISYIAIEHEAKLSIHQKDEPLKRPCMQISGNWHVPLSFKRSYPFEDYRSLTKDVDGALGTLLHLFWSTFY